jgi:hypothetical protein
MNHRTAKQLRAHLRSHRAPESHDPPRKYLRAPVAPGSRKPGPKPAKAAAEEQQSQEPPSRSREETERRLQERLRKYRESEPPS